MSLSISRSCVQESLYPDQSLGNVASPRVQVFTLYALGIPYEAYRLIVTPQRDSEVPPPPLGRVMLISHNVIPPPRALQDFPNATA